MDEPVTLDAVEVHAEGEPSRIVTSAAGLVHGSTMAERLAYCRAHLPRTADGEELVDLTRWIGSCP